MAVKGLKLYGTIRVDLLRQGEGLRLSRRAVEEALGAAAANPNPPELMERPVLPGFLSAGPPFII